jgi:hypothetical protein
MNLLPLFATLRNVNTFLPIAKEFTGGGEITAPNIDKRHSMYFEIFVSHGVT